MTNVESLLFFDIETAARNKELELDSKEFELFAWSVRDRVTGAVPPNNEVQELYKASAALKPEFNRIVCISAGFVKDNVAYTKTFKGDQKEIIKGFYDLVNSSNLVPAGYNIVSFDLPVVRLKALEEGVSININDKYIDSQKKPWNMTDNTLDLMEVVKGTYYHGISLDNACYLAGVTSPKEGDVSGANVSSAYYSGKIDKICEYCERDVVATIELFMKLQDSSYKIDKVVSKSDRSLSVAQGIVSKVSARGEITAETYDEIMAIAEKLNAKERGMFVDILTAALLSKEKQVLDLDETAIMEQIKSL